MGNDDDASVRKHLVKRCDEFSFLRSIQLRSPIYKTPKTPFPGFALHFATCDNTGWQAGLLQVAPVCLSTPRRDRERSVSTRFKPSRATLPELQFVSPSHAGPNSGLNRAAAAPAISDRSGPKTDKSPSSHRPVSGCMKQPETKKTPLRRRRSRRFNLDTRPHGRAD